MQNPLAKFHWSFLLNQKRLDWGSQVNPLCRHDITSPFPPSGNEGYVRNQDVFLGHRSRNLDLKGWCPAEFSSNPYQTHLKQLI